MFAASAFVFRCRAACLGAALAGFVAAGCTSPAEDASSLPLDAKASHLVTLHVLASGSYVRAVNGGGGDVDADSATAAADETLRLYDTANDATIADGMKVVLQAPNGDYVGLTSHKGTAVDATSKSTSSEDRFVLVDLTHPKGAVVTGDHVAFATSKNLYLSAATASPMSGDAKSIGATETFVVTFADAATPSGDMGAGADAGSAGGGGAGGGSSAGGSGTVVGARDPSGFFHPGVVVTAGGLDSVKARLAANDPDLTAALAALLRDLNDTTLPACPAEDASGRCHLPTTPAAPSGHITVTCGSHSAAPAGDTSCDDEKSNALAAYTHALAWYLQGDETEAQTAITFLDAWNNVTTHTGYTLNGTYSDNSPLQCGWTGTLWARAAELIRYTYPSTKYAKGWSETQATAFGAMLTRAIRPYVITPATENGNWELSQADALMQISVYNDQLADFKTAAKNWLQFIKYYVYLQADGKTPKAGNDVFECTKNGKSSSGCGVDYWWGLANASGLADGTAQETCRDLEHVQYGLGSAVNAAETAAIQQIAGVDLYGDTSVQGGQRLYAALEFQASLLKGRSNYDIGADGKNADMALVPAPSLAYSCDGTNGFTKESTGATPAQIAVVDYDATKQSSYPVQPMWEEGYNYFVNVAKKPMPNTAALLTPTASFKGNRPTLASHPLAWETLTKLGVGAIGFPQ